MKYTISTTTLPNPSALQYLFSQTTWAKNRNEDDIKQLLSQTKVYVVIKDKQQLIGFGRAISDGIYRAMLDDIVVDQEYQKQGLGKLIVTELLDQLKDVETIFLNTKPELEGFYNKYNFTISKALTMSLKK
ncbi:GNAT family N-acetyltransferase [Aquimarina algicola]|uniref:GNAT family N-acetyltransferase n=1 Tax=Aquimarina algicola TaxID=2589995 RepID=A0A504JBI9_9FLAO|nr:GNAT family N-acetyltransferase [Aquimarina algicola]TPN85228.1 GNAT family N-acetyltransferase [Aquimarina algicola]